MATPPVTLKICSTLECKRNANALCLHCNQHVCTKHYIEHVKRTNDELLPLSDQLNSVINTLHQLDVTRLSQHAVKQLEQWRTESHHSIDELCDEKTKMLNKIAQLKLDDERSISQQLNDSVRQYIDQTDASHQQVEKIKKDIRTFETRCSTLNRSDFFHIKMQPLQLTPHSLMIKAIHFSYFTGGGSLLSLEYQFQLNEWVGIKEQNWKLIYKAQRDGFKSEDFHRCSDNQGPTLTIIQSKENGWLFGGYTSQAWTSSTECVADKKHPFLFTLTNPHNIPPTQYPIELNGIEDAVVHNPEYGPTFGGDFDLHVCDESDTTEGSCFNFPESYIDTTAKGALTFTGDEEFETSDIEVYRLL